MALTKKDVEYVARLARLALTESEKEKFTGQLSQILDYFEQLKKIDTTHVSPTAHPFFTHTVWKEDQPKPKEQTQKILANAPEREDDFFKVRKVIE
jgi:aspartyl-tRNA(Asn)/glutamyl-tRNA(Gln) amidotransferase subunit C